MKMDESSMVSSEQVNYLIISQSFQNNNHNSDDDGEEGNDKFIVHRKKKSHKIKQNHVEISINKKYSRVREKFNLTVR